MGVVVEASVSWDRTGDGVVACVWSCLRAACCVVFFWVGYGLGFGRSTYCLCDLVWSFSVCGWVMLCKIQLELSSCVMFLLDAGTLDSGD